MKSLISLISPFFIGGILAASYDDGKSYHVYHKLGDSSTMTSRGRITIAPSEEVSIGLVAKFHPDNSAHLDITSFDAMVKKSALYTIIILEDEGDASPSVASYPPPRGSYFVSASVPGCSVRRSNLREEISLSISPTGKLMSVSYRPIISPLAPKICHQLKPLSEKPETIFGKLGGGNDSVVHNNSMPFKTTVSFDSHTPMMVVPAILTQQRPPPGLKWYRRNAKNNPSPLLGGAKQEGGGGIPGLDDEPPSGWRSSFLYKYWYIILPVVIAGLFGGTDEGDVNNQRTPQQSSGAAATAAVGAVAAGGAAQGTQRRGKRD